MTDQKETAEKRRSPFHQDLSRPLTLARISDAVFEALSRAVESKLSIREPADVASRFGLDPASEAVEKVYPYKWLALTFASALTLTGEVRFNPITHSAGGFRAADKTSCFVVTDSLGQSVATLDNLKAVDAFLVICHIAPEQMEIARRSLLEGSAVNIVTPQEQGARIDPLT